MSPSYPIAYPVTRANAYAPANALLGRAGNSDFGTPDVVPADSVVTFDPAHKGTITLSNGNLTATGSTTSWNNAFGTVYRSAGKWYAEITVGATSGAADVVGLANATASTGGATGYLGFDLNAIGWVKDNRVLLNNINLGSIVTWTTGNVLCIAVDLDNGKIWFRVNGGNWNNNASANPATNAFGISLATMNAGPYALAVSANASGSAYTANFGASSYAQSVPSGFKNWGFQNTTAAATVPLTNQIYQRDTMSGGAGLGTGSITLTLNPNFTGTFYARTRKVSDLSIDQASFSAGTFAATGSQNVSIAGLNARLGFFYLDVSKDNISWTLGTTPLGMGELVAISGQSLAVRIIKKDASESAVTLASLGLTPNANGRVFAATDTLTIPTAWTQFADGSNWDSAGGLTLLDKLITMSGVNCGIVQLAIGSTMISTWQAGQANGNALFATMDAAGGKFGAFFEMIGHSDSANGNGYTNQYTNLTSFFASVAAHNSFPSFTKILASIPNVATTSWGTVYMKEGVRRATLDWATANSGAYLAMDDLQLVSDGTHESQTGSMSMARHIMRAMRPRYSLSHTDAGITLGQPTHGVGSQNIVIPYTLQSGATTPVIAGDGSLAFKVYQGGDRASPLAYAGSSQFAFDNSAKTFTLKLAADPGQVSLTILPYGANDSVNDGTTNQIWDDLVDGDGFTTGRNMTPGSPPLKILTSRDLTGGGTPTYAAGKFSNGLTSGFGTLASPPTPGLGTGFTMEAWVKVVTPDSVNTQTIFGSVNGVTAQIKGNDLLVKCDNSAVRTYTGALPTGTFVHIALVQDAGTIVVNTYIAGVKNGTVAGFLNVNAFVANNTWGIGRNGTDTTADLIGGSVIDEVALFETAKYTAASFTPPVAAYVGNETNLIMLYHLDSSLVNSAT